MSIINEALKKAQETNKQRLNAAADQGAESGAGALSNTQVPPLPAAPRKDFKWSARARWFLPVLTAVIIISGILVFFKSSFRKASPAANLMPASPSSTPAKAEPIKEETRQAPAPVSLPKTAPDFPNLKLSGIVYDNERPYAIVNDKVLSKGDMVEGATLIEINRESVKFIFNDKELELSSR